jgi:hypothetical protein
MIDIITFKWKKSDGGYKLKNQLDYSSEHVNILFNSIKRNTTIPFNFHCVTDDKRGLLSEINYIPLWDKCRHLGGCYNRLYVFSYEMRKLIGKRLMIIDLDSVIVGNLDKILSRQEDFIINEYRVKNSSIKQIYNGGLVMMNAGARSQVWDEFNPDTSPQELDPLRDQKLLQGSDQAWIQYKLGENESTFTTDEGVYDFKQVRENLPDNATMIFFPGREDPKLERENIQWIKDNWKL